MPPDPEKLTPTPHNETPIQKPESEKKIFKNFPARGPRKREAKILPIHRKIFENFKEQGMVNFGLAVRRTGVYTPGVAKRGGIKNTKSWKMLMAEYMPEEHLAMRHAELLDKREILSVKNEDGGYEQIDMGPDTNAVSKGLDMAYKLRGSFKKEEDTAPKTVMYNLFYKPEVREQVKAFEDGIKKSLINDINFRTDKQGEENVNPEIDPEEESDSDNNGGGAVSTPDTGRQSS